MLTENLPASTTPFLGRQDELRQIRTLLDDPACRLITLIGPGGIGKTRLALEVAGEAVLGYADGVYFVSLQSLSAADLIVPAVAEAVQFPFFFGNEPEEQLFHYLESKSLLLVLDNFEHLLEGAVLVSDLLARAPGVKVITTSRERLNLQEEWLFEVDGLRFPGDPADLEGDHYSAIALFAQSARRVRPTFSLEQEGIAVARICALVGGMPLALELASAWVRVLSCDEIADEIQRGLDILETSARNVPSRHRDMRAVLDHSWLLLTEDERAIVMKLSAFQGGFTREAAREVTGASPRLLSALVDKSWLRWQADQGRYDVHELLRQYGQGKLDDSGDAESIREAHVRWYSTFMERQAGRIKFGQQVAALTDIEQDFENVRAAWKWAARTRNADAISRMSESLNFFGDMRARWAEAEELFGLAEAAFSQPGTPSEELTLARVRARRVRMIALGMMATLDELCPYVEVLEAGVEVARACGDRVETAVQLSILGMILDDSMQALEHFEAAFMIFCDLNDLFYMAESLVWMEVTHHHRKLTKGFLDAAMNIQRESGDQNGLAWTLIHLSRAAYQERDYAAVERYIEEAMSNQRARGDKKGLYWSVIMSAQWAMTRGDFEHALALAESAMQIANNLNLPAIRQSAMATLGLVLIISERDHEAGARLCTAALEMQISDSYGMGEMYVDAYAGLALAAYHAADYTALRHYHDVLVEYLLAAESDPEVSFLSIAPPAMLLLSASGQLEQAAELCSAILHLSQVPKAPEIGWLGKAPFMNRMQTDLRARLGGVAYEAAWQRGRTLDIRAVTQTLLTPAKEPEQAVAAPRNAEQPAANGILTERELEVLHLIAAGLSNREIAARLVLALGTVKWYVSEVYSKLGVTSRTQAVARARDLQLIA